MRKLVVLSGAGISAESGIRTFRDSGGLWEGHDILEVASPVGWEKNKSLVLDFYNQRRKQEMVCQPNLAHQLLVNLEEYYEVQIITQNVDSLHERAGSSAVLHLHGELRKARSSIDPSLIYELDHWEIKPGDHCEKGSQLRPHIVWFGEEVPEMETAIQLTRKADVFVVVGTSLQVYPAAALLSYTRSDIPIYLIDPQSPNFQLPANTIHISKKATEGMSLLAEMLLPSRE